MRRVKEYFSWEEQQWLEHAVNVEHNVDGILTEGRRAYAYRQALIRSQLRAHCETLWKDIPADMAQGPGLPEGPDGQSYRVECH